MMNHSSNHSASSPTQQNGRQSSADSTRFLSKRLKGVQISGIGSSAPSTVVTNQAISTLVDTSDEWISSRTGILERRVVQGDEKISDFAVDAAKKALAHANLPGESVDLIVAACSTPDTLYPGIACVVQQAINAKHAAGFDLALACTGFIAALNTAEQFLRTGTYRNALVIGADVHSRYMNWTDRNTCILFGDGAGACVLTASDTEDHFFSHNLHIDGWKGAQLLMPIDVDNCPLVSQRTKPEKGLVMNGREVFKFAVSVVPSSIEAALAEAGLGVQDIDFYVLHQANIRIMQSMSERLNIPADKLIVNLDRYGNTSAASIPLALDEAVQDGRIQPGMLVLLCGFGGGLSWGTSIMRWTCAAPSPEMQLQKASSLASPVL
ncbi:MAG: beta-ketoacyl-ACP synthase III [Candidatus Melainabacteria bacterium]|nr:beta-ketoacyl-ACP synthase III [Candidatus Melainabacteria bacterium]